MTTPKLSVTQGGARLEALWPDGETAAISARWLFDHLAPARDPISGQRLHGALRLQDVRLQAAEMRGEDVVALSFNDSERMISRQALRDLGARPAPQRDFWLKGSVIAACPPIRFDAYMTQDFALAAALQNVARLGLTLLTGAGTDPGSVEAAVARFGFVRETNYGRTFDVRIEPGPGNLAFTDKALDLHTDNPYREPAPGLQLLHALTPDAGGGQTLFADGLAHAQALAEADPAAFHTLSHTPARFTYREASGATWSAEAPILELDAAGRLAAVRLNHRSMVLDVGDADRQDDWYEAYLDYYSRVHADGAGWERRLEAGDVVIFDNRRILHGRRAISTTSPRRLRGCYADMDGLKATLARLRVKA